MGAYSRLGTKTPRSTAQPLTSRNCQVYGETGAVMVTAGHRGRHQGHRAGGHPGGGNTRVKLQKGQHVSCGVSGGFGQGGRGKKGRPERWGWGTWVRRVSLPTCAGQLIGPQPRAPWKGAFSHPTPHPGRRSWEGFHSHLAQLWPFCPVSRSGGGH